MVGIVVDSTTEKKTPTTNQSLIADRYRIDERLGGGAQAEALLARDESTDRRVFVKQVVVDRIDDWKSVELFERESEILEQLDHPAIPDFVDAFHEEADEGAERFVLVQEYVDGSDLEMLVDQGERFTEEELRRLAREILEILRSIHSRETPLIHRDIKPSNIMRRVDGRYVLVDFGTVRIAADSPSDSTAVGTVGYTPFEQLAGRVRPVSDLYALGMTLIHLASRVHPGELPVSEGMGVEFRDRVQLSDEFVAFVATLAASRLEDRFQSARNALWALENLEEWAGSSIDDRQREAARGKSADMSQTTDESKTMEGRRAIGLTIFSLASILMAGGLGIVAVAERGGDPVVVGACCWGVPMVVLLVVLWVTGARDTS